MLTALKARLAQPEPLAAPELKALRGLLGLRVTPATPGQLALKDLRV
jgi:hypothetical protein